MGKLIVKKLTEDEIEQRRMRSWPIWEKEVSRFPYEYDSDEECLILEGEVIVKTDDGNALIQAGDFVIFRKGLQCVWNIRKPVRKHYNFPD